MSVPKKLIEVAMPIKEISAESVRDKSIRNGHISTLHLWWARRPLPVCRAVIFASLVPDPLDENCPENFKEAVRMLLGKQSNQGDPYKPYDDIPYTAAIDKMEDNLRNRLMMFIGKFSNEYCINEKAGKPTTTAKLISEHSLIKWENKDNESILNKARKLIWVAHNTRINENINHLLADFDQMYNAIKTAEYNLYTIIDRHLNNSEVIKKSDELNNNIEAFLNTMPKVFDPFAGGGAIPLEAARLGCRSFGNDINPVAHIIQKGSLEFPQKYGKPITYSKKEFVRKYSDILWKNQPQQNKLVKNGEGVAININNRLSFDVEFYAKKIISETEKEVGYLYPSDKNGNKPLVYYWSRIGICSNPSCKAEVPLLKQFYISKRRGAGESNWVYLKPHIHENEISFEIKKGKFEKEGWVSRGNMVCPCCGNATDVKSLKQQFIKKTSKDRLLAVIGEEKGKRYYRQPSTEELEVVNRIKRPNDAPSEAMPVSYTQALPSCTWGVSQWGDLFSDRQLLLINTLVKNLNALKKDLLTTDVEYGKSIITYLSILIDRIIARSTTFGVWHILQETVEHPFGRQAIPMIFDYPEMNLLSSLSGAAEGQLFYIIKYIESETSTFHSICNNAASGEREQFPEKSISAVVTDPPYYDAIAYADISDFFYVWLKRSLSDVFPYNFSTPQTPKSEECTALKHHHSGDALAAKTHFESKLLQIFDAIEHQTSNIVSIMFAHQSTEAWTTLCNSILYARMNITGSWAFDTEITGALKSDKAFLSSSVTVSCAPTERKGFGNYRNVKRNIEETVEKEVIELYQLGFRGADLLTACFGKAVSEFGKYEKVEKADGSEVTVSELLAMARESAFNALLKGFEGDDFTKFYIGWLQLFGFTESDFDDAAKFSRVGLRINVSDLFTEHILIKNGNKQTLGSFEQRLSLNKNLGDKQNGFLIDQVHRAMALYKGTNRNTLLQYIDKVASSPDSSFWRVITSLCEVLPIGCEDHKQGIGLLTNKDSLIRESKTIQVVTTEQSKLFE
jgi:putative DNA methylase